MLDSLGLDLPASMNVTADHLGRRFARSAVEDAARLADVDEIARFRDRTVGPVSVVYIVAPGRSPTAWPPWLWPAVDRRRLSRLVGFAALLILATPPVAFLSGLCRYDASRLAPYVVAVFVVPRPSWRCWPGFGPPVALRSSPPSSWSALNWFLQVVDVVLGSRLQLDTPFGYSPIVAGRFQGLGNLAFALLAASAIVVATGARRACASRRGRRRRDRRRDAAGLPRCGRSACWRSRSSSTGCPVVGADVGGVLATVPAFALVLVLLAGWRVSIGQGAGSSAW